MKFKNATSGKLTFPYGDESESFPRFQQTEHGQMRSTGMRMAEKIYNLEPGEEVDLPEAIAVQPYGVGANRPSYLESAGLLGKLVPVAKPAPKAAKA